MKQVEHEQRPIYALGFSPWKRGFLGRFLDEAEVCFVDSPLQVPPSAPVAVWGSSELPGWMHGRHPVLRIEDGFLRSVGLGADLYPPMSLVVDWQGLHYDATRPSDLESMLQEAGFDAPMLARAARLRETIIAAGVTKYNVGARQWRRPDTASRVVLVIGQVESDAALRYGAPVLKTNAGLLRAVRQRRPGAYLVYKPHPDVVAGLRRLGSGERQMRRLCHEVVTDVSVDTLLNHVDEVHVMTSLAGFEALLRGLPVTTYGQPFYAGWGLTHDECPVPRRTRRLTLDQLVAGALIMYPRYVCPGGKGLATPEEVLAALVTQGAGTGKTLPVHRRLLRMALRLAVRHTATGECR